MIKPPSTGNPEIDAKVRGAKLSKKSLGKRLDGFGKPCYYK